MHGIHQRVWRLVAQHTIIALRDDGLLDAAASLEEARYLEALDLAASAAADHTPPAGMLAGYTADVCFYARDAGVAARAACVAANMTAYALAGDAEYVRAHNERLANERAW